MGYLPSRGFPKRGAVLVAVVLAFLAAGDALAQQGPATVTVAPVRPAGDGGFSTIFTVDRFGRYAVAAASVKGAALRLVDRMAGPGDTVGTAGGSDGRVDVFLGPGDHKAELTASPKEAKPPGLTVQPFQELNAGTPPQLQELALVETQLGDLQQRSWWLDIRERRSVFIEAAGRHLGDLRLWKDGTWLVDAAPTESRSERQPGQPLAVRSLATTLAPGLYLLTAYGAPGEVWGKAGEGDPLVLRWGVPTLSEAGRHRLVTGPFGFDRWLVPKHTDFFRLEIPRGETASLSVAPFGAGGPGGETAGAIERTARLPVAEVRTQPDGNTSQLVTVTRSTGAPYILQHYATLVSSNLNVPADGDYLLTTLRPGRGDDDVDLTALLGEVIPAKDNVPQHETLIARQTVKLGPDAPWRRSFNLSDAATLFVEVTKTGRYRLDTAGIGVNIFVNSLNTATGDSGPQIDAKDGVWDLDAGFYQVRVWLRPNSRGVLSLSLHADGGPEAAEPAASMPGASFGPFKLRHAGQYHLRLNEAAIRFGAVLRRLPIELADDLPLVLAPGERRTLPLSLAVPGVLSALTEDDTALPLLLDTAAAADKVPATAGRHQLVVTNPGAQPVIALLHLTPDVQPTAPALPPLSAETLKRLPNFPLLEAGQPRFLDLGATQEATFNLKVGAPALYRVETTGLLQTGGTLRTRLQPSLARASANGVGRNFLLQSYLREGLYQLTVATEGATAGHLGVVLTASAVRDGGLLTPGVAARASLGVGEGVSYGFDVASAGRYHLRALSLTGATTIRLEDAEGWPLTRPEQTGDLERELQPGHYRLVVLPHPLPGRLLTLVDTVPERRAPSGHGPHLLPLDGSAANRWEEPTDGGPRRPDLWSFDLPAEAGLTLSLGESMEGEIRHAGDDKPVATFSYRRPWHGRLAAGSWQVAVRSVRPDNRLDYTIAAQVDELVAGLERPVTAPARIPVALGGDRQVELSSFGEGEVRAVLLNADGGEVATSDQRPGDWNFVITAHPPAGQYVLKVEPLADKPVDTTVRLQLLDEVADPPLAPGATRSVDDGKLHLVPLDLKSGDGPLLVVAARSEEPAGLVLERRSADGGWRAMASAGGLRPVLALPRDPAAGGEYRLRVWSQDHSRVPVALAVAVSTPPEFSESALAGGFPAVALAGMSPPLAVAAVRLDRPGLFRLAAMPPGLMWSAAPGQGLGRGPAVVVAGGSRLWFLAEGNARLQARRIVPAAGEPLALTVPGGSGAVVPVADGAAGPRLWLADSRLGQPGLTVARQAGAADARVSGVGAGLAAAVLPAGGGGAPMLRLWRADGAGELPLALHEVDFPAAAKAAAAWGDGDLTLAAGTARDLSLPAGAKRLRLALPPRTAAALLAGGVVQRTLWSEAGATVTLDSVADSLLLLNAGKGVGLVSLRLTPAGADELTLTPGALLRRALPTAGTLVLEVGAAAGRQALSLAGPVEDALLVQADGTVRSGTAGLTVDGPALLVLRHRPGTLAGWLGDGGGWLAGAAAAPPLPATLPLSGAAAAWRFTAPAPILLHLAAAEPVLSAVARDGAAPDFAVWSVGAEIGLFLPAGGETVVGLRPLAAPVLAGSLRITATAPSVLGEGAGPKLRLAPGDSRLYAFDLKEAGPVGFGVRGDADSARLALLDAGGHRLAEGAVAMTELKAGRYFLLVSNRADAATLEVQPVLVGVAKPGREPPDAVKRHYWKLVTGEADEADDDTGSDNEANKEANDEH